MTNTRTPPASEQGWLAMLKKVLSGIRCAVGDIASDLFQAILPHVNNAWTRVRNFVIAHPSWVLALVALVLAVLLAEPLAKGLVEIVGFTNSGIRAGSIAPHVQARFYGACVPAGSIFAFLQSFGALL